MISELSKYIWNKVGFPIKSIYSRNRNRKGQFTSIKLKMRIVLNVYNIQNYTEVGKEFNMPVNSHFFVYTVFHASLKGMPDWKNTLFTVEVD